ncbi:MAG: nif-specific transcriptional activator NifA [Spirochaetia bacterium]|nr:nif-specific transcriptional activator NifA [Spirochaetia bacterium]MCF7946621.1 nif-specific transcriptional activator NifA [Spirochaetia bacterium]
MNRIKELTVLFEISRILDETKDLKEIISPILTTLSDNSPLTRGAITLLNRESGQILIESAIGLTDKQKDRGKYKIGEGVTGQVVKSGKPIIISDIAEAETYANKTKAEDNSKANQEKLAFVCVPIKIDKETIGTFNITIPTEHEGELEEYVKLLSVISSMIARAVKLRQEMMEETERLIAENIRLKTQLKEQFLPNNIIGRSQAMQEVFDLIGQVCKSEATVLIRGDSGTGKELVAQEIHYNSFRADKPFVKVNCAALPESIIESELFGHEKGAFTGAMAPRKGRFELADGGTLFLDEIGELSPQMQVKLLRVLQEQEFERVGGTRTIKIDVRIVAATNRNLEEEIKSRQFREDLYYRLNVFPIHIPPLRERKSDIMLLCDHFIEKYNKRNHRNVKRITSSAIDLFMSYHWPGNVRELENCIERAVLLSTDRVIHAYHLPPSLQSAESSNTAYEKTLKRAVEDLELDLIKDALKTNQGNSAKAARQLGITDRIMGLRIKKYQIDTSTYKHTKM